MDDVFSNSNRYQCYCFLQHYRKFGFRKPSIQRSCNSQQSLKISVDLMLSHWYVLVKPNISGAGLAGLFFVGVPGVFSGPDFSGIHNLPFCDSTEPTAKNSAVSKKPFASIPI